MVRYAIDLLEAVAGTMGVALAYTVSTKTYNENIAAVAAGAYDVFQARISVTSARETTVDFSTPFFFDAFKLAVLASRDEGIEWVGFLSPFALNLWLMAVFVVLAAGALFHLFESGRNEGLRTRGGAAGLKTLTLSLYHCLQSFLGRESGIRASTAAGRALMVGVHVFSLILLATCVRPPPRL